MLEQTIEPQPDPAFEPAVEPLTELILEPIIDPLVIEPSAELPELIFEPLTAPEELVGGEPDELDDSMMKFLEESRRRQLAGLDEEGTVFSPPPPKSKSCSRPVRPERRIWGDQVSNLEVSRFYLLVVIACNPLFVGRRLQLSNIAGFFQLVLVFPNFLRVTLRVERLIPKTREPNFDRNYPFSPVAEAERHLVSRFLRSCPRDGFDPFSKVVDAGYDKLPLPSSDGKRAKNIEPPLCGGPRSLNNPQFNRWLVVKITVELAVFALLYEIDGIFLHRWPIISLAHDFECQVLPVDMRTVDSKVDFTQSVVCLSRG
ncbi:hypothetical protein Nepgr_009452 [Nepenthes gracilis]|uniref:Uncharacterized protein n=1 Tax=Nepenthes gracilis TaxID=150966 RepID=A0AAD3SAV8_NEPGR|nr:hypothetical protein Nepgr_009452 [Nepenthes gracilis]